jgi:putative transposase
MPSDPSVTLDLADHAPAQADPLAGILAKTGPYLAPARYALRRVKAPGSWDGDYFHVMSRTCGGAVFFDDVEKEALRQIVVRLAAFTGIEILTYCIMGNHFHLLLRIPQRQRFMERFEGPSGEQRLMEQLTLLYSKQHIAQLTVQLKEWRAAGMSALAEATLARYKRRMCDLSCYVKEAKERFSRWYNKRHERKGTLWMERYRSVLVEGRQENPKSDRPGASQLDVLKTMAAYIDLNPVRAGLVADPGQYRWSGYSAALSGDESAQKGLCMMMGLLQEEWEQSKVAEVYHQWLATLGMEVTSEAYGKGKVLRRGIRHDTTLIAESATEEPPVLDLVHCKFRHFTDGLVLGGREFVNQVFETHRELFGGKRKTGARKIKNAGTGLYAIRDLRK